MLGMSRTGLAGAALRVALTALLPLVLPAYYVYKLTTYLLGAVFPEDVAGKVVLITGASSGIGEVRTRVLPYRRVCGLQERNLVSMAVVHTYVYVCTAPGL
jgi:hypothetical protein